MANFRKTLFLSASVLGSLFATNFVQASVDTGCVVEFRNLASQFNCGVLGILDPSNDTRDNLMFLMADRQKQVLSASTFNTAKPETDDSAAYGEGTICVSAASGSAGFQAAVMADTSIPPDEKAQLVAARLVLKCDEGETPPPLPIVNVQSPNGKAFRDYLVGIEKFYRARSTDNDPFAALTESAQPWVREAANYMQARTLLLASQANALGEYGDFDPIKADKELALEARNALNSYLIDYPTGTYANSARGLLRRAAWFMGDAGELATIYSQGVAASAVDAKAINFANELDLKLPLAAYTDSQADTLLLAVQLLRALRARFDDKGKPYWTMTAAELEAYRLRFAGNEQLFEYLQALRAYLVDTDTATVLQLLDDPLPTARMDYVTFSRMMLRGRVLAEKKDPATRDFYMALLPHATQLYQRTSLELRLTNLAVEAENISDVFSEGSVITDPDIRIQLLDDVAGPIILKQQATSKTASQEERDVALYRLLARDLKQGRFKGFGEDIKLLPPPPPPDADGYVNDKFEPFRWKGGNDDGYACPGIVDIAAKLATTPKDVQARLCHGDFLRVNYIQVPYRDDPYKIGETGTIFAGAEIERQAYYLDIMKSPKASRTERAYALFRAVNCYAPIGNNACGGKDATKAQRKAWYTELKTKYADTDWAKKLQYYW